MDRRTESKTVNRYRQWRVPIRSPQPLRLAAIDIGTNTVLLACVRWHDDTFTLLCDEHRIARLGEGLRESGEIRPAALERTVRILRHYRTLCTQYRCDAIAAVGTSALRRATNRTMVVQQLEAALQAPIQIISGAEEARLTYAGSVEPVDAQHWCSVLDIGGGSTEIATGQGWKLHSSRSLEIGVVRLTETFFPTLPPTPAQLEAARIAVETAFRTLSWHHFGDLFAVGGTPTTLAALALQLPHFDPAQVHGVALSTETIHSLLQWLVQQPLPRLQQHPVIHPERADVLPAGTLILHTFLEQMHLPQCIVSSRGLRFGVLLQLAQSLRPWDRSVQK